MSSPKMLTKIRENFHSYGFTIVMWGVRGLRRIRSGKSCTHSFVKRIWLERLVYLGRRWGRCLEFDECLSGRNRILGEDQHGGRKLLEGYTFYLRIECSVTTLLVALMKKWLLNSVFTASNPFFYLQQNLDGTSIQGRVLGRTSGGPGCQEGGYIRRKKLYREGGIFWSERNRVREIEKWTVYCLIKLKQDIYKNFSSEVIEEYFFQQLLDSFFLICEPLH